jgi:DNA-binding NarL/FixJ family response regulator
LAADSARAARWIAAIPGNLEIGAARGGCPGENGGRSLAPDRQTEVMDLIARGVTNANFAATLGIEEGTVAHHVSAIFIKAGVQNRASLIALLLEI